MKRYLHYFRTIFRYTYVHSVNITSEGFVPSAVKVFALVETP